jgi:hypothetical protein
MAAFFVCSIKGNMAAGKKIRLWADRPCRALFAHLSSAQMPKTYTAQRFNSSFNFSQQE